MIGIIFIVVTLLVVVTMIFIPDKHIDRVALIAAFLALSVTAYGVYGSQFLVISLISSRS